MFVTTVLPSCSQYINYPTPSVVSLNPATVQAGQPAFTLNVTGYNFVPNVTVVEWGGLAVTTLPDATSPTNLLHASISASQIASAGQVQVTVFTPQPGGGTATPSLTFTITAAPSPIPQITNLLPSTVLAGSSSVALYVAGTNFVPSSVVTVNGDNRTTTYNNSNSLSVMINASDVARSGAVQIAVVNPLPGGGSSNIVLLSVTNPVPSITTLTPSGMQAGGTTTSLQVGGSELVPDSVVYINGAPRTTTFDNSTGVNAQLTAGDLAAAGIDQVQVFNPAPGGGMSNTLTFAVNPTDTAGLPVLVDVAPNGTQASNGICGGAANCSTGAMGLTLTSAGPSVSTTGELVAFASISGNLVANQANSSSDIFLRDTCLGVSGTCTPATSVVSVTPNRSTSNGPSSEPSLDSAGDHAAFTSLATNLVVTVTVPARTRQVYWIPTCNARTSSTCGSSSSTSNSAAVLVSSSADGLSAGNGDSYNPVISPDGMYVAFVSLATNLVANPNSIFNGATPQVFIANLTNVSSCSTTSSSSTTTTCTPTIYLVSTPDGTTPANGPSSYPSISNDGLYVSFTSTATNLGASAPNPNGTEEVFVQSTCVTTRASTTNTCSPLTTLASTPDGTTPADDSSAQSSISADGRFIAFASVASNLGTVTGGIQQIFVRDTCTGVTVATTCTPSTELVSTPDGVTPANGLSESPRQGSCTTTTCTAGGQLIAFASVASNLGANTANGIENIFVRNTCLYITSSTTVCTPTTALASQAQGTSPPAANGNSVMPAISSDGHTVSFLSFANNLVAGDTNGLEDIFLAATTF